MKSIDVNSSTYIDFVVENINKDFKPQVCELVQIIFKCKTKFTKGYASNCGLLKF